MLDPTICGHDRALLRWACAQSSPMIAVWSTDSELAESERGRAVCAIVDPAKLAAIIAELFRGHALLLHTFVHCDGQRIAIVNDLGHGPKLTMPQARAFALTLLDAPNATAQDIERMIEEVGR